VVDGEHISVLQSSTVSIIDFVPVLNEEPCRPIQ